VDDREMLRSGPSYTFDTLAAVRAELGDRVSLSLVVGADACAGLDGWYRWRELFALAHLVVMARPHYALPASGAVADVLRARRSDIDALDRRPFGAVVSVALTPLPISASAIRALIGAGRSP